MENKSKLLFLNNAILKIIALILMTLDHVGIFLQNIENTLQIGTIFRYFGRIAFPLFILIIVEGVKHTKHFGKYILKLGIIALIFLIGQVIFYYNFDNSISDFYSPLLDVVIIAVTLYLLKRKDKFSYLSILPIAYILMCFIVINIERTNNINILWLPFFLRIPYALFDLLLALGFFYSSKIASYFLASNESTKGLENTIYHKYATNLINVLWIIIVTLCFYVCFNLTGISYYFYSYQIYSIFAAVPVLFYSGERGYDKKWFKYGAYLYLPLHILIIYLIFSII